MPQEETPTDCDDALPPPNNADTQEEQLAALTEPDFDHHSRYGDAAITYWAWHSGNQGTVTFGGDYALTTAHAAKFREQGRWHFDIAGIQRGDIVFFDWGGSDVKRNIDHVGIVTGAGPAGVLTIDGNYDDVCARHVRRSNSITGYGRPAYVGSTGTRGG